MWLFNSKKVVSGSFFDVVLHCYPGLFVNTLLSCKICEMEISNNGLDTFI